MSLSYHHRWTAMATIFDVLLEGEDEEHLEAVAAAVEDEVRRQERLLSRFDPASEISRINREAPLRPSRIDPELWRLLAACDDYRARTGGAFDVTTSSPDSYVLETEPFTIRFPNPDTHIDLGGVGKGYALDQAEAIVRRFGITRGLLSAGTSSIIGLGVTWPIDIRHPAGDERPPVGLIPLSNRALSCSAVRRQDQATSDILDPSTGRAIAGEAGCLVLAPSATEAEVLSTALLVMGRDAAARYLEREPWPAHVAWIEQELEWLTLSSESP